MDKITANRIEIEGAITLNKIRKIVKENFDEKGRLKKKSPDIVIVDYPEKLK